MMKEDALARFGLTPLGVVAAALSSAPQPMAMPSAVVAIPIKESRAEAFMRFPSHEEARERHSTPLAR